MRGVHRIVAAVIEEEADVMRAEDFDESLVLGLVLVEALQLVARRPEGAARRVLEARDGRCAFLADIDQVFREGADDSIAARV